jgi:hypothetical protein
MLCFMATTNWKTVALPLSYTRASPPIVIDVSEVGVQRLLHNLDRQFKPAPLG